MSNPTVKIDPALLSALTEDTKATAVAAAKSNAAALSAGWTALHDALAAVPLPAAASEPLAAVLAAQKAAALEAVDAVGSQAVDAIAEARRSFEGVVSRAVGDLQYLGTQAAQEARRPLVAGEQALKAAASDVEAAFNKGVAIGRADVSAIKAVSVHYGWLIVAIGFSVAVAAYAAWQLHP